jgi:hypothetical protein
MDLKFLPPMAAEAAGQKSGEDEDAGHEDDEAEKTQPSDDQHQFEKSESLAIEHHPS